MRGRASRATRAARRRPPSGARGGFTLVEAVVALLLGLLVVFLGLDTLARLDAARARMVRRTDALVALRVARHVLRRETRHGIGGRDWTVSGDSLGLRAFRGAAVSCASDSAQARLHVSYGGDRDPDPTKDSVLLVTGEGRTAVRALVGAAPTSSPCGGPLTGQPGLWQLDSAAPAGTVAAKLFERGAYHLSGSALRYRRGAGGRQPLTPEVWSAATGWSSAGGWARATLVPSDPASGPPWTGLVAPLGPHER